VRQPPYYRVQLGERGIFQEMRNTKKTTGSKRYYYAAIVSIIIVAVALLAGITGCNGGSKTYSLTIASTAGGSVTAPGEGTFDYASGTVVQLAATPDDGYKFQAWTGNIDDIGDPNSASTNITINGDCSVAASFEQEGGPSPSQP
jgi:hypothetical protein